MYYVSISLTLLLPCRCGLMSSEAKKQNILNNTIPTLLCAPCTPLGVKICKKKSPCSWPWLHKYLGHVYVCVTVVGGTHKMKWWSCNLHASQGTYRIACMLAAAERTLILVGREREEKTVLWLWQLAWKLLQRISKPHTSKPATIT